MFGSRSSNAASHQPTILVTQGDTWAGFYAAHALLKYHHNKDTCGTNATVGKVIVAVLDRNNAFVEKLAKMGAEIRDYDINSDKNKFKTDLLGEKVDGMVLIPVHDEQRMVKSTTELIAAASEDSKLQCLVLWSVMHIDQHASMSANNWKKIASEVAQIEKLVKAAKVEHEIILSHAWVAQMFFALSQVIQNRGLFPVISKTNKYTLANAKDIARVSAMLISSRDMMAKNNHQMLNLTGPKAHTAEEILAIMNASLGSAKIELKELDMQEMEAILEENENVDAIEVGKTLFLLDMIKQNKLKDVSQDLQKFLGSAPKDIDVFFKENADSFKPNMSGKKQNSYINQCMCDLSK